MRITHQSMTRNYLSRMNRNLNQLNTSNDKLSSGRAFNKSFEDVTNATKALRTRVLLDDNVRYQTTVKEAQGRADSAEDGLRTTVTLVNRAQELVIQSLNGTISEEDRSKIAAEVESLQGEVFQIMNSSYSDSFLFAASGGAEPHTAPFSIVGDQLQYNGTPVDSMVAGVDGNPTYLDVPIPYNTPNYVDIGFGYQDDGSGQVDENTAFLDTFSGVESFGFGKDANGMPLNVWSLFGDIANNLRSSDMDGLDANLTALPTTMDNLLVAITEIGARSSLLDNTALRLENEYINLSENQNDLEFIDVAEEMMFNKTYERSWMITLQLGSKILPETLFNFLR